MQLASSDQTFIPVITSTEPEKMLTIFPLAQIFYVGSILQNNSHWALLKLPNGKTLAVHIGSLVGTEKAQIRSINTKEIVVNYPNGLIATIRYFNKEQYAEIDNKP